ncbi:MAG: sulfatase [Akkermansiaceae bacterium]
MIKRLLLSLAAVALSHSTHAAEKPNILLILVDDLGYGDLACYGAKDMQTPSLDTLMKAGTRYDQFYANCTVCTPTRASLMTGRYPDLVGAPGVIRQYKTSNWGYFRPTGPTLPEVLKKGGYHTGMVGKWHLGYESPNIPNDRGFDHFHGFLGDMMNDYYTHLRGGVNWMRHNKKTIKAEGHATEVFTRWAIDYLKDRSQKPDEPFFLYLAYNAPHFPIQPPKDWRDKVMEREKGIDPKRAANVAFIEHLDHEIGKVINSLKELGLSEDTIVIFTSDNGGSIPHAQSNLPLRGGKQDHWEGGIRVPTCVVWPGKIPAGKRSDTPGMTMDFLPTLAEIAGLKVDHEIDGQSLAPVWTKGAVGDPDRTMIWVRREGNMRHQGRAYYAIRQGNWKLLQNTPFEPMVLINLKTDPYEKNPQPAHGKIANKLNAKLMQHIQKSGKAPWQRISEKKQ